MNVKGIMDLGGSQSTSKVNKGNSTSKSQAASSDLFKSIIGQKQASSQKQGSLDVQASAQQAAASKPQQAKSQDKSAVQDTSSKDSAPVNKGNDSTPADNLDNTQAVEEAPAEDVAVEETEVAEEPVMEDEAAAVEEPIEEDGEEKTDVPKQIFLMQMPVAAAAATIAPVIISSENYQASSVDTIVNDVVLDQLPQEPQVLMQVTEANVVVSPDQMDIEVGQFTVLADAQDVQPQQPVQQDAAPIVAEGAGQDAVVQITDSLQEAVTAQSVPTDEAPQPAQQPLSEAKPVPQAAPAAPESTPVQVEQEAPPAGHETAAVQQAAQEAAPAESEVLHSTTQSAAQRTDAADQFAAQVVKEAKDMVQEQHVTEGTQEAAHNEAEISRPVEAKADADDTDDAANKGSDQNKSTTTQQTMPGTATVAEDGRVDLRTSAAQPLEAEQFLQPETRQMIMNRVVDQVRSAVSPDRTEFYIQLKPDFLGGLSIGLVAEEKGIVAKIMTTSQQVHSALQADMTALQRVLQERGINVVEMEVIYNQMADTTSKDNSDNRQQQFSQGGNNRSHGRISEQTEDALAMYDNALTSQQVLTENGGSVEFTA